MWPRPFPGTPLSISAGLGSLSSIAVKYLVAKALVCLNFEKNYFFH